MREAQVLKAQIDAARQKEAILKECIQPWLDEAFAVSTNIEGNLAHMQVVYEPGKATETNIDASMARIEQVQQMVEDFVASVSEAQKLLNELCVKIAALAE